MTTFPRFPAAPAPCPSCGATVWVEARFCHRCGAPIAAESREPPTLRAGQALAESRESRESRLITILPWLLAALALGALVALLVGQRLGLGPSRLEPADTVVADSLR